MESGMGRFVFVPGSTNTWRMAPSAAGCPSTAASIRVLTEVSPRRVITSSKSTRSSNRAGPLKRIAASATTMSAPSSTIPR